MEPSSQHPTIRFDPNATLRHRLPNPPVIFVGRDRDVVRLGGLIRRGPVTVIAGRGGVGKTALCLQTLHLHFREQVPSAVFVSVRPGDGVREIVSAVVRASQRASSQNSLPWLEILTDTDALMATAIDHSERTQSWVILDDLHHAGSAVQNTLIGLLMRYLHQTRWVITTRERPEAVVAPGQIFSLAEMDTTSLAQLARECDPALSAADANALAAQCNGTPWDLLQRFGGASYAVDALPHVSAQHDVMVFLSLLARLEVALPEMLMRKLVPQMQPSELMDLERSGWVVHTHEGYRLHDLARERGMQQVEREHPVFEQAAEQLATMVDGACQVEALSLWIERGNFERAEAFLEQQGDWLIRQGHAARLARVLVLMDTVNARRWRLRCALELGDDTLVQACHVEESAFEDRVLLLRGALLRGRLEEAEATARRMLASAVTPQQKAESQVWLANLFNETGQYPEAMEVLSECETTDLAMRLRRDALRSWVAAVMAMPEIAQALAMEVLTAAEGVEFAQRLRVVPWAMLAAYAVGHVTLARRALEQLADLAHGDLLVLLSSRESLHCWIAIEQQVGHGRQARMLLERLTPFATHSRWTRLLLAVHEAEQCLLEGRLRGLEAKVDGLLATEGLRVDMTQLVSMQRIRVATLRAEQGFDYEAWMRVYRPSALLGPAQYLAQLQYRARRGDVFPEDMLPNAEALPNMVPLQVLSRLTACVMALCAGNDARAMTEISHMREVSQTNGWRLNVVVALQVECDVLVASHQFVPALRIATMLREMARDFPSPRFEAVAALALAVLSPDGVDLGALENLALLDEVSPEAMRRSRALLDGTDPKDALDARVVAGYRAHIGARSFRAYGRARTKDEWTAGWAVDPEQRKVWITAGRPVDLASRGLCVRILSAIAAHGGSVSKEALARSAWGLSDYHPLRDDKRMQVAMRQLRLLIEDRPSEPRRIVTLEDGYAFGDTEPLRFLGLDR